MSDSYYPVPLKKIELTGNVVNSICAYQMVQHYVNIEEIPLETVFLFPKTENTVMSKIQCQFKLEDGTIKITETQIEERKRAEQKYEDSISKGQTAVLGTQSTAASGGFTRV